MRNDLIEVHSSNFGNLLIVPMPQQMCAYKPSVEMCGEEFGTIIEAQSPLRGLGHQYPGFLVRYEVSAWPWPSTLP